MLNWRWKSSSSSNIPETSPGGNVAIVESASDDEALDSLANLVRVYSQYSSGLSTGEAAVLQRDCDAWARHILTCGPRPGAQDDAPAGRDWRGLRSFFQSQRKQESERVSRCITDLRQAIWMFIDGMSSAFAQDQDIDTQMTNELQSLRVAVEAPSTEDLRRAVLGAVSTLSDLVEDRKKRQDERMFQLGTKVSELSEELQEVRKESSLDGLTRLFTRKPFEDYLNKAAYLRKVFGQPCCLLMVDLDHFKEINDQHGHPMGDHVLRSVSDMLARSFPRRSDFVARFGGDEFAVVLSGTTQSEATRLAERFSAAIRTAPVGTADTPVSITVSVGVVELNRGESSENWLARTDAMLYEAKRRGRDCVVSPVSQTASIAS